MITKICDKHKEHPARIYSQCVGCEIDNLNQRIKEQEELLKWFRARLLFPRHKGDGGWTIAPEYLRRVKKLSPEVSLEAIEDVLLAVEDIAAGRGERE